MDTRELKKLADDATGFMAKAVIEASIKVSRSQEPRGVLENYQLRTFSALAGTLSIVQIALQDRQSSQDESISRRLPRFLCQLQAVCTVNLYFRPAQDKDLFPTNVCL